jgi:hypothetical protein
MITQDLGFAQQGTVEIDKDSNIYMSDTWHLAMVLNDLLENHDNGAWARDRLEKFFEFNKHHVSGCKFIFMDSNGNYKIHNEKAGVWDLGCWFSNYTYCFNMADWEENCFYDWDTGYWVESKGKSYEVKDWRTKQCPSCNNQYVESWKNWSKVHRNFVCDMCFSSEDGNDCDGNTQVSVTSLCESCEDSFWDIVDGESGLKLCWKCATVISEADEEELFWCDD